MDEYIERKALENAMAIAAANGKEEDCRVWARAICLLHAVQTADVAHVIHGKWLIAHNKIENAVCSACGTHFQRYYDDYSYCPHCGAKMNLEEHHG